MPFETIEEIREFFADDQFARKCLGATIDDRHHNAQGFVMGGVFFSLADYALAVSCNVNQPPTASVVSSIEHMRRAKGKKLIAVAKPDKAGRALGFFTIDVYDDLDNHVARMTSTVMRTEH